MSEQYVPLPEPDPDSYRDPKPPLCPECRVILQNLHPASRADARWEGWCPTHGNVIPTYSPKTGNDEEVPWSDLL